MPGDYRNSTIFKNNGPWPTRNPTQQARPIKQKTFYNVPREYPAGFITPFWGGRGLLPGKKRKPGLGGFGVLSNGCIRTP